MAPVHDFMSWLSWSLLTLTAAKLKNPVHDMLFPTQDVMENLLLNFVFATGLLNVSQFAVLPTMDFFKSLPTDVKGFWRPAFSWSHITHTTISWSHASFSHYFILFDAV
jgi:hypothetical protein